MDLSIIIPNYNTKKLLKECLESVISNQPLATRKKPITDHRSLVTEIIVVDNGSTDSSVNYLKKVAKNRTIQTIFLDQNWGFAGAVNKGIKKAKGKFILLLNSDTQIQKETLKEAVEFAENHPLAIIGLQLVNLDGSIQPSVYHFPSLIRAIKEFWLGQEGSYQKYFPQTKKAVKVDAVTGAAMLIPKKVIKDVGLFDEKYFFYFEDLDYCRRAKKAGLNVYYLPSAKVFHHHGAAGREMPEITHQWLVESSKKYNSLVKYYLLTSIIWLGQKWRRFFKRR
ncbi:glycosyltransferase family 2 protein [Patescibacteria group bacterium]|nr:glycosyltransferase family 2 protein [Patescibacteria group bacterium]